MIKQLLWALGMYTIFQISVWTREIKYGKSKKIKTRIIDYSLSRTVSLGMAAAAFFVVGDERITVQKNTVFIILSTIIIIVLSILISFCNYIYTYRSQTKKSFSGETFGCKFHCGAIILNAIVLACEFAAILFFAAS